MEIRLDGQTHKAGPGKVIYIPANTIHQGGASEGKETLFFTCKDSSHGLHGVKHTS